jgi:ppGpp synthetase/RelA/SpoT-type nucleotidyltranferase/Txe/YoeB family toxin of Txe-Axe toxin-antitoxin module
VTSPSKGQIDRLGERLKEGLVSEDDLRELDAYRESFTEAYDEVVAKIRSATGLEPTGRPRKTPFSILQKLRRERSMQLSRMQDIAGFRLVVAEVPEQDRLVGDLVHAFEKATVVDRRQRPSHGYRAVHVIARVMGRAIEIQVRTELQNLWAQLSEVMSDVWDPAIKYGGGHADAQRLLALTSGNIASLEEWEMTLGRMSPERVKRLLSDMSLDENEITPALIRERLIQHAPELELKGDDLDRWSRRLAEDKKRLVSSDRSLRPRFREFFGQYAEAKARLLRDMKTWIERFAALPRKVN